MILDDFKNSLTSKIDRNVMYDTRTKPASVMIVIYDDNNPKILMTKKSSHLKIHAGEIAFPGGNRDPGDPDLLFTALRETKEELDLKISESQIIGQLAPVRTLNSNFTIIPFISILGSLPPLRCNNEVELVLRMPADSLLRTLQNDPDPKHRLLQEMYTFTFEEHLIWGASARMLKQVVDKVLANKSSL